MKSPNVSRCCLEFWGSMKHLFSRNWTLTTPPNFFMIFLPIYGMCSFFCFSQRTPIATHAICDLIWFNDICKFSYSKDWKAQILGVWKLNCDFINILAQLCDCGGILSWPTFCETHRMLVSLVCLRSRTLVTLFKISSDVLIQPQEESKIN